MKRITLAFIAVLSLVLVAACGRPAGGPAPASASRGLETAYRSTHSLAATTSAVAWSISVGDAFDCSIITLKFDSAPTTSEDITATLNSVEGAAFDTVLRTHDPSVGSDTSVVLTNLEGFVNGDSVDIAYTNTDGNSITGMARCEN